MNKATLAAKIAEKMEVPVKTADAFINAFEASVTEALKGGDDVRLTGFGTFSVKERAAHNARNIKTGEMITVPAKKIPAFKSGKVFRDNIG